MLAASQSRITGKERDSETGLDYFGARYNASNMGRFMSPDQPFADQDPGDPQSWNLYAYVRNNPLRFIDPTGMKEVTAEQCQSNPDCQAFRLNVVLDTNADIYNKNGSLLPEYQKKVDAQIAETKDELGSLGMYVDVTFSQGAVSTNGGSPYISEGLANGALNVAITDVNGVNSTAYAAFASVRGGQPYVIENVQSSETQQGTIPHEIAHQLNGEAGSIIAGILNVATGTALNAILDTTNNAYRGSLRGAEPFSEAWGYSKYGRYENPWRVRARRFSK